MDRVITARERVQRVKSDLRGPAILFPCINCRYYQFACTHPAVAEVVVDPETGATKSHAADPKIARSEDGACGPEGALFDSRSVPGLAVAYVFSSKRRVQALFWLALIGMGLISTYG